MTMQSGSANRKTTTQQNITRHQWRGPERGEGKKLEMPLLVSLARTEQKNMTSEKKKKRKRLKIDVE